MKYEVFAQLWKAVEVEANSPEEARELAQEIAFDKWDDIDGPPMQATPKNDEP